MVIREREREREWWHGILFEEPFPNGSRPRGLIGLWRMTTKETRPPRHTRKGKGDKENPNGEKEQQGREGANRGATAARPTLTRDWGGPQVKDPVPVVSVNPEADPPQPSALFKRETEHLCLRQLIHGIRIGP